MGFYYYFLLLGFDVFSQPKKLLQISGETSSIHSLMILQLVFPLRALRGQLVGEGMWGGEGIRLNRKIGGIGGTEQENTLC